MKRIAHPSRTAIEDVKSIRIKAAARVHQIDGWNPSSATGGAKVWLDAYPWKIRFNPDF
jgi:hypothetical protein